MFAQQYLRYGITTADQPLHIIDVDVDVFASFTL